MFLGIPESRDFILLGKQLCFEWILSAEPEVKKQAISIVAWGEFSQWYESGIRKEQ